VEQKRSVKQTPLDLARCLFGRSFSLHTAQSAARLLGVSGHRGTLIADSLHLSFVSVLFVPSL
jgi:hypothetical protein